MQKQNNYRNNRRNRSYGGNNDRNKSNDDQPLPDESNAVVMSFRQYAKELDDKHDRYERIIKHSRDITIESKRIIFLLHTIDSKKNNKEQVLKTAAARLAALFSAQFAQIANELNGFDPYQYTRAFGAGLQEFIEAYTYHEYLVGQKISDWNDLQKLLTYEEQKEPETVAEDDENATADDSEANQLPTNQMKTFVCLVQPIEFMLGLGDLCGEVMRHCINALGSGDLDECFEARRFLQFLYTGFTGLGRNNKELSHKIYTLKQSVQKVENVCYNIKVRGGEATKLCSDKTFGNGTGNDVDEDEGFANY